MSEEQRDAPKAQTVGFTGAVGALIEAVNQLDARLSAIEERLERDGG
jgi:hypothetical protein